MLFNAEINASTTMASTFWVPTFPRLGRRTLSASRDPGFGKYSRRTNTSGQIKYMSIRAAVFDSLDPRVDRPPWQG